MSLEQRLQAVTREARATVPAAFFDVYERFLAQLKAGGAVDAALGVGDPLPEFLLPNAEGRLVSSSDLASEGPLVISFFRGPWCPYCMMELAALQEALPEIVEAGGKLVAITPEVGGLALRLKRERNLGFDLLSDPDNGVGLQFGVVFALSEEMRRHYRDTFGVDLSKRHGNESWFMPVPATFVADRTGIIRYRFVDTDYSKRAEPAEVVAFVRGLVAESAA